MGVTHIPIAEAADHLRDVLRRVQDGEEIVIETDGVPIRLQALLRERTVEEAIEIARNNGAVMDPDFAADMRAIVVNRKPRITAWD